MNLVLKNILIDINSMNMMIKQFVIFRQNLVKYHLFAKGRTFKTIRSEKKCNGERGLLFAPKNTKSPWKSRTLRFKWSFGYAKVMLCYAQWCCSLRSQWSDVFLISCRRHTSRANRTSLPKEASRSACGTHRWKKTVTFVTVFFWLPLLDLNQRPAD